MTQVKVDWHIDIPAVQTLDGLKVHLRRISLGELNGLCFLLKCDSIADLAAKMWRMIQEKRKQKKRPITEKERERLSRIRTIKKSKKGTAYANDKFLARSEAGGE